MKFIVGRKLNMTQLHAPDGAVVPVTVVAAGEAVVTQVKTKERDGYSAVQFGFNEGGKHTGKALAGHVKNALTRPLTREVRLDESGQATVGQKHNVSVFAPGDVVAVTGISKGRGFSGVVKRHHFHGSPKTHGHKHDLRAPGSIGATDAQRVFPGRRMSGRMGAEQVTIKNQTIWAVDAEKGLLYIKGAVPGARNSLVIVKGEN